MARNKHKIIFPWGVFLLMFITQTILGTAALSVYTYLSLKKNISVVEEYTRNYSKTLAEAFASLAELSLRSNKTDSLTTLFHEKIEQNTIDEAIFVMADGRLAVHSNTSVEKGLSGNISSDGMAYNLELILEPVRKNSRDLFFSDYNIIDRKIPFSRWERELIGRYIYPGINKTGWLFTKGVFIDGRPAGSVCFLTGKERIYKVIRDTFTHALKYIYVIPVTSFILSLMISFVILSSYRSIRTKAELATGTAGYIRPEGPATSPQEIPTTPVASEKNSTANEEAGIIENLDNIVDEPVGDTIIDSEYEISVDLETASQAAGASAHPRTGAVTGDEGYMTVEFLGEIHDEPAADLPGKPAAGDYIARRIPEESLGKKGFTQIRDAIPARRGR